MEPKSSERSGVLELNHGDHAQNVQYTRKTKPLIHDQPHVVAYNLSMSKGIGNSYFVVTRPPTPHPKPPETQRAPPPPPAHSGPIRPRRGRRTCRPGPRENAGTRGRAGKIPHSYTQPCQAADAPPSAAVRWSPKQGRWHVSHRHYQARRQSLSRHIVASKDRRINIMESKNRHEKPTTKVDLIFCNGSPFDH